MQNLPTLCMHFLHNTIPLRNNNKGPTKKDGPIHATGKLF